MAIDIRFDLAGNPEPPTIILANRNGNMLGQLDIDANSIEFANKLKDASEITFTMYKKEVVLSETETILYNNFLESSDDYMIVDSNDSYLITKDAYGYILSKDMVNAYLWDKVVDFKLVYCKEWDCWFEIKVELDEETETTKTVFCTQLGQAELSQIMLYNVEINTEDDIARDDYKMSILWDEEDAKASILDRVLEKAPHYSIVHVDDTIKNIQRSFSFNGTSIYDAFQEIEEEIGCLFVYHSNLGENGKIQRTISVYDLEQNCLNPDCKHRGEFADKCPKCGGTNIQQGFGKDTLIFVTADELASEGIQLTTDTDSVKNCFKLEGGDDLMTATIRNCNPNGTDYIWYFSDAVKEDMSEGLVDKLNSYNKLYKDYYNNHESKLNTDLVNKYNALVTKYEGYYNTKSTCFNCDYEGFFEGACPECGSTSILFGKKLQSIPSTIKGYSTLMNAYYNTIDLALYLNSSLMPTVEMSDTNAQEQANLLTVDALSPVAVNTQNKEAISLATANSAVLSMAKVVVRPTYKVEVKTSTLSNDKVWEGSFVITNYSDENDTAESDTIRVVVNNDTETFVRQKLDKALNKDDTDDYSISGLFEKEYGEFCEELKKYALNPLKSFYDSCDTCINILIDNDAGDKSKKPDLYEKLYEPYYKKSSAIADEIKIRESEIAIIEGVWDETDEENPELIAKGLQQYIEECRNEIQGALDFQKYLGEELWLELCCYRREDTYSNENYISDGLNNAELFEKALEFIEVAENEIYKSAELQHSISADLNNLLAIEKFKPLVESFEVGNWIRVRINDEIFKLRLLEYDISFGNFDNISVDFSDVTKIKNGITDIKSIMEQASSMATSYSSVQRQAKQGKEAQGTVDKWLSRGLNSAIVQIQNNNNEEITLTKNGLLGRSYDDISGVYSPKQFKLTHNIMAYTTDNWETVSAALGEHEYTKWANNQWVQDVDYGLSSKFVTAGYITGSQIIGGEIVSSNYKIGEDAKGTYVNLIEGDFDFAGGKIVYDSKKNKVTLSGVTIQWDNVNKPTIENIDGLSGITDDIRAIEQGLQATTINNQYVISPNIIGGYLNIKNNNNVGVVIDPDEDYIFQVYNSSGATTIGVDKDGNASFDGNITAKSGTIAGFNIGSSQKDPYYLNALSKRVTVTGENGDSVGYEVGMKATDGITDLAFYVAQTSDINDWTNKDKRTNLFYVRNDGYLLATNANITGTITSSTITSSAIDNGNGTFSVDETGRMLASIGNIGGWNVGGSKLYGKNAISKSVIIGDNEYEVGMRSFADGTTIPLASAAFYVQSNPKDKDWSIDTRDMKFYVSYGGHLYANDAEIIGTITSSAITGSVINNGNGTFKVDTNGKVTASDITVTGGSIKIGNNFDVDANGNVTANALKATNADISGKLTAGEYSKIGDFKVDNNSIFSGAWDKSNKKAPDVFMCVGSDNEYTIAEETTSGWAFGAGDSFGVTNSGSLYCTSGKIGGWEFENTGLFTPSGNSYIRPDGSFRFGNVASDEWCGFFKKSDTDYYQTKYYYFTIGANCRFQFGKTTLTESDFEKLLKLIK